MREIKFRQYYEGDDDSDSEWNYFDVQRGKMVVDGGWQDPQQYTGLHDKNGVEIYEGDIVRWQSERLEVIEFPFIDEDIHTTEVIGNIYENKELLGTTGEGK